MQYMDNSNIYIQKEVKKQIHQNEDKNIQDEELDTGSVSNI